MLIVLVVDVVIVSVNVLEVTVGVLLVDDCVVKLAVVVSCTTTCGGYIGSAVFAYRKSPAASRH